MTKIGLVEILAPTPDQDEIIQSASFLQVIQYLKK